MSTPRTITTADELWRMQRDGMRRELVRGALRMRPPAGFELGVIITNVASLLGRYVVDRQHGGIVVMSTGFQIATAPDTVRAPSAAFVSREGIARHGFPEGYWPGAPDLVVEVDSPDDPFEGIDEKVADWLTAGTRVVWVLAPEQRTVTVHGATNPAIVLTEDDEIMNEPLLPGFAYRVREFFRLDRSPGFGRAVR